MDLRELDCLRTHQERIKELTAFCSSSEVESKRLAKKLAKTEEILKRNTKAFTKLSDKQVKKIKELEGNIELDYSQAERIKELEKESKTFQEYYEKVLKERNNCFKKIEELEAQLTAFSPSGKTLGKNGIIKTVNDYLKGRCYEFERREVIEILEKKLPSKQEAELIQQIGEILLSLHKGDEVMITVRLKKRIKELLKKVEKWKKN